MQRDHEYMVETFAGNIYHPVLAHAWWAAASTDLVYILVMIVARETCLLFLGM